MTGMDHAIEQAARALWECDNLEFTPEWRDKVWNDMGGPEPSHERVDYEIRAEYLAQFGLLAPAPLREEWAARYTNGGGAICPTRDEAETELDRMTRDSHRHRVDEPPAPEIAGIVRRYVTGWETP